MSLPHNFRLRPDLIIQLQDASHGTWVVKDPVSLRFFLFGTDEHFILQRLNGKLSMEEIIREFIRERAPKRMTATRLQAFLSGLHRNGLACSDSPGQSSLLLEREEDQRWRESVTSWTNLLAIRLPGFNPDVALDRIYSAFRWCFSWWVLLLATIVCCFALGTALIEWESLATQWPRLEEFVAGRNLVWLGVALISTKCLHELAHALTCKHFGGRCHEMGVMFLLLTPCLYCNVTDAWMLRSRWQRIAISAAGMLLELFLASVAMILWRYSQPGALNSICFNVIVVCGVSTFLFNGNPLLKYDGYYILSDLVRIPNLWQESRAYLYGLLNKWFLGGPGPQDEPPGRARFLTVYAIASILYRIVLTLGILLFLYRVMHPQGFDLILLAVVGSLFVQTVYSWSAPVGRWLKNPLRMKRVKKGAVIVAIILVASILAAVCLIPFPYGVVAPAILQPRNATRVYVMTPGVLIDTVSPGDKLGRGKTLGKLENAKLRNQQLSVASDVSRAEMRVKTLQARLNDESEAAAQLMVAQEILTDLTEQLRLLNEEYKSLTLITPVNGTVISPQAAPLSPDEDRELPAWTGTPLDLENRGCYLERGTLFCLMGDLKSNEAVVLVDETDVAYVRVGQHARLRLELATAEVLTGRVVEIAEINTETAPEELVSQHDVAVRGIGSQQTKLVRTLYQVRVALDASEVPLLVGARGRVRILVEPQTIAERIAHWFQKTIRIDSKS
jgi:putative peptide zinc metalloprotease protein